MTSSLERRPVVALFMDVSGFTPMVESSDPEDVRERLKAPFELIAAVVRRHGGRLEKYIGDAMFVVFGADRSHRDDVDRAVMSALEAREHLGRLNPPLDLHAGIEIGEVLVDRMASVGADDLAVVGDCINVAARLVALGEAGDILLGPEAAALTSAALANLRLVALKGKAAPLNVATISGWPERSSRSLPFRGRQSELAHLLRAAEACAGAGRPMVLRVIGAPGIGKSRLMQEAAARTAMRVMRSECPPPGEGTVADVLQPLIDEAASDLVRVTAGESEAPAEYSNLVAVHARIGQVWDAWRKHFERLADQRGLLLTIDDAQWCPDDVRDLLVNALTRCEAPILMLLGAWSEYALEGWTLLTPETVNVGPLPESEALALAHDAGATGELAELLRQAAGNPLYLLTVGTNGRAALPLGLRAAMSARLDALPAEVRRTAQAASLISGAIDAEALAATLATDAAKAKRSCDELVKADILEWSAGAYSFRHRLLSETSYASLSRYDRGPLHLRVAEWLRSRPGRMAATARHLDLGGDGERALQAYREAALDAMHRFAHAEAADLLKRAGELTTDANIQSSLGIERGHALAAQRKLPEAIESFTIAERIAVDPSLKVRALCGRAITTYWDSRVPEAEADARAAIQLAEDTLGARAEPELVLALVRTSQGRSNEASILVDRATAAAAAMGMDGLAAMGGAISISIHHHAGRPRKAVALMDEVAAQCRAAAQPGPLLWTFYKGGLAHAALGSYAAAFRCWEEVDRIAGSSDYPAMLAETQNCRAHAIRELGGGELADTFDLRCLEIGTPHAATEGMANAHLNLACGAINRLDYDGAEERLRLAQPALDAFAFFRWRYMQRYRHYRALLDIAAGDFDSALAITEESLAIGRQTGEGKNVLRPRLVLAAIQANEHREEARSSFREAAKAAERLGLLPIAWRARAAAAELGDDDSRRTSLIHLAAIADGAPEAWREHLRRNIASLIEDRNYTPWRLAL
jgi:class 3 adenylate cyclase